MWAITSNNCPVCRVCFFFIDIYENIHNPTLVTSDAVEEKDFRDAIEEELDEQALYAECGFCRSGDNEAELILCDGCDCNAAYHMECLGLRHIPDGEWICPECEKLQRECEDAVSSYEADRHSSIYGYAGTRYQNNHKHKHNKTFSNESSTYASNGRPIVHTQARNQAQMLTWNGSHQRSRSHTRTLTKQHTIALSERDTTVEALKFDRNGYVKDGFCVDRPKSNPCGILKSRSRSTPTNEKSRTTRRNSFKSQSQSQSESQSKAKLKSKSTSKSTEQAQLSITELQRYKRPSYVEDVTLPTGLSKYAKRMVGDVRFAKVGVTDDEKYTLPPKALLHSITRSHINTTTCTNTVTSKHTNRNKHTTLSTIKEVSIPARVRLGPRMNIPSRVYSNLEADEDISCPAIFRRPNAISVRETGYCTDNVSDKPLGASANLRTISENFSDFAYKHSRAVHTRRNISKTLSGMQAKKKNIFSSVDTESNEVYISKSRSSPSPLLASHLSSEHFSIANKLETPAGCSVTTFLAACPHSRNYRRSTLYSTNNAKTSINSTATHGGSNASEALNDGKERVKESCSIRTCISSSTSTKTTTKHPPLDSSVGSCVLSSQQRHGNSLAVRSQGYIPEAKTPCEERPRKLLPARNVKSTTAFAHNDRLCISVLPLRRTSIHKHAGALITQKNGQEGDGKVYAKPESLSIQSEQLDVQKSSEQLADHSLGAFTVPHSARANICSNVNATCNTSTQTMLLLDVDQNSSTTSTLTSRRKSSLAQHEVQMKKQTEDLPYTVSLEDTSLPVEQGKQRRQSTICEMTGLTSELGSKTHISDHSLILKRSSQSIFPNVRIPEKRARSNHLVDMTNKPRSVNSFAYASPRTTTLENSNTSKRIKNTSANMIVLQSAISTPPIRFGRFISARKSKNDGHVNWTLP
eukprot:CFRG0062T1